MDKIPQILENVVRCKYFEAGVHITNPIRNSYEDGLGRTTLGGALCIMFENHVRS